MSRFEFLKNSFSRYLGRTFCLLIELKHSAFEQPFYFINDTKPLEIEGIKYEPCVFDVILPSQTEKQGTQITMSNESNQTANEIKKTVYSNENIIINLYCANVETQTAEKDLKGIYELENVQINSESVTGVINIRHNLDINMGFLRYNNNFPNLSL